jgi:hypothetical protein
MVSILPLTFAQTTFQIACLNITSVKENGRAKISARSELAVYAVRIPAGLSRAGTWLDQRSAPEKTIFAEKQTLRYF